MAEPRVLMDGLVLVESPRWHHDRLWFCDWGAGELIATDVDGDFEVVTRVESFPFCIDWLPDGQLLVVAGGDRRLLRREPDGSLVPHAELAGLSDQPWNEIAVDGRGYAYLNGIGFDLMSGAEPGPGVLAVVTPDGTARKVAGDLAFPNGMAITPDGSTLIVAESYASRLTAFDITADGDLANRRVWAELDRAAPDGICLDAEGALWYADVGNQSCVRVAEGGTVLDTVNLDRGCFSCALGGPDGRTLFMMAARWQGTEGATRERTGQVLTITTPVPAAGTGA